MPHARAMPNYLIDNELPLRYEGMNGDAMASLMIRTEGFRNQVFELRLGANRFGRNPANDFQIDHPTVSSRHCEIALVGDGLEVRDCNSTNGTFVDGLAVQRARLSAGQILRLGEVELVVESTEVNVAIPKFDPAHTAPPVVMDDGSLVCPRHPGVRASYQCIHCHEVLCADCVHDLRRKGSAKGLKLCPLCSHRCEPLGGAVKRKKKHLFGLLEKTVKLPFHRKD